jgi:hypothetical protein
MISEFMPYDIANAAPEIQRHYLKMVSEGQTPRFAEMAALQKPPGTRGTDRAFQQGRLDGNWMDEMPVHMARRISREAKAAGISTTGKYYMSGLADKRGHCDPEAWVSDLSDVRRVAKKRNLEVRGIVNVDAEPTPPKNVDLDPKIARDLARKEIAKNPSMSMKEAIHKVKQKHVPRWKKKVSR